MGVPSNSRYTLSHRLLRLLGCVVGALAIAVGVYLLVMHFEMTWWRNYVVPICLIGTGVYFLNYGLTGRATLIRRS